jgi:hypothetical protein
MQTLTLEIQNEANYNLILALAVQLDGVWVKNQNTTTVAEESAVYKTTTPKTDNLDIRKYQGCWTYPATFEETEAKLKSIRDEWDRDFF